MEGNLCSIYDDRPSLCRVDDNYIFFEETMTLDEYHAINHKSCIGLKTITEEDVEMPLPIILGVGAAIAGLTGVGGSIYGAVKVNDARKTLEQADSRHKENIARFESQSGETTAAMDALGKKELEILNDFERFSSIFEKIKNKPEFKTYHKDG